MQWFFVPLNHHIGLILGYVVRRLVIIIIMIIIIIKTINNNQGNSHV